MIKSYLRDGVVVEFRNKLYLLMNGALIDMESLDVAFNKGVWFHHEISKVYKIREEHNGLKNIKHEDLKKIYEVPSNFIIRPGDVLKEYMDSRNFKREEVAKITNHSETYVNTVLKGYNRITPNFAYKLEKVFPDVKAEFWLQLEYNYDIFLMKEARKRGNTNENS